MQYWVVFNENELKTVIALLECPVLSDVVSLDETFLPDDALVSGMVQKGFLVEEENGRSFNGFVHFVMNNVVSADSVLKITARDGSICFLYFKDDVMVLLNKFADKPEYIFYLAPFIPKAVGGVSAFLTRYVQDSPRAEDGEKEFSAADEPLGSTADLAQFLESAGYGTDILITVEEDLLNVPVNFGAYLQTDRGFFYAMTDAGDLRCEGAGYYELAEKLAGQIIRIHGCCMQRGEARE